MSKIIRYLKPYWHMVLGVVIFTLINVFAQLYIPNLLGDIVDVGVLKGDIDYIISTGTKMLGVAFIGSIAMIIASYLSSKTAMGFGRDLRSDVFTKVEYMNMPEFNKVGTSSLITRTTNDINQLQQVMAMVLRMMVRAPIMLIGGIIMAVSKNLKLSQVFLISAPILVISLMTVGKKAMPYFKEMQERVDYLNQVLREELTGVRVIRAFNKDEYEKKRLQKASKELSETMLVVMRQMSKMRPLLGLILNFTIIGVLVLGSKLISTESLVIGDLIAFIQYVMQIMFSLVIVSMMIVMLPRAAVSANRVKEILDIEYTINDKDKPVRLSKLKGHLIFDDVSFKYLGAEEPVLCDISFEIEPGKTTAIIGGTGSGKSTLINLIPRFYDVSRGKILLDGKNIKDISQKELRNRIGFVSQNPNIFSGTIRDNITMGNRQASDEEIKEALEISQSIDFINELDDGIESYVSQGGKNFSGGQKQRLSIARTIIKNPDIYIFDDSFSALDFRTDRKLREALGEKTKNATKIVVAQRINTITDADKIILIDEGRIVGEGRHEELIKNNKIYREIAMSQLSEEEINNEQQR